MQAGIRFGIICGGSYLEKWQIISVNKLLEIENTEIALIITDGEEKGTGQNREWFRNLLSSNVMFKVYYGLIRNKCRTREKVNMSSKFPETPRIVCKPVHGDDGFAYYIDSDVKAVKRYGLDFILDFGNNSLKGEVLNSANYGVWSFVHDDVEKYRGELSCFWEIYRSDGITGAALLRLTGESDGGIILNKGYFPTIKYSYTKNLDRTFLSVAGWPAKIIRGIIIGNEKLLSGVHYKTNAPIFRLPNNRQMIKYLFRVMYNIIQYLFRYLCRNDEWNIGFVDKPIHSLLSGNMEPRWLPRPDRGTFLADPFGKSVDGKAFVMVEDLNYHIGRADIAAIEISSEIGSFEINNYSKKSAVKFPCHMSYPYVIDYKDETYLIPETYENRRVTLLKAKSFPGEWEEVATLIDDFAAVDPTVFYYNGCWWLMCTNRDTDSNSDLYIWYSKDLLGPWKPHNANPVKTDIRSSRPGGTPFVYDGELYRPAQNSIVTYGGSLIINKVTKLTDYEFEEEEILEIKPDKNSLYNKGIHTVASIGDMTIIDGKRFVFLPSLLFKRCVQIVRRFNIPQLVPKMK